MMSDEVHNENDASGNVFNIDKELVERSQDMGSLFNSNGESFNLREGQGFWASYEVARTTAQKLKIDTDTTGQIPAETAIDITINGVNISTLYAPSVGLNEADASVEYTKHVVMLINAETAKTGVVARSENDNELVLVNENQSGTEDQMKNINLKITELGLPEQPTPPTPPTEWQDGDTIEVITAFKYTYSPTPISSSNNVRTSARSFTSTEDVREAMQKDARLYTDYEGTGTITGAGTGIETDWDDIKNDNRNDGVEVTVNENGQFQITNPTGDAQNEDDGDQINGIDGYTGGEVTADELEAMLARGDIYFKEEIVFETGSGISFTIGTVTYSESNPIPAGTTIAKDSTVTSSNPADKINLRVGTNILDINDHDMFITISGYSDISGGISVNSSLVSTMNSLKGSLPGGDSIKASQGVYAASAGAGINIYDSLGSKHDLRFDFTKIGYTSGGGTDWSILIKVPEPGDINNGAYPKNIVTGTISFGPDGSLSSYSPSNLIFSPNNGSSSGQDIELDFGSSNRFDGLTSFDRESSVSSINQNGYAGGDLNDIRIDQNGVIIGTFSNGRSLGLAQISTAKFTNNGGLENDGGNTFLKTSNSGEAVIGKAGTGGRASIQSSSLEMSNVDLSRSLTQLIIVQRGFQANSKTITTSDQLLNTLLSLKQ